MEVMSRQCVCDVGRDVVDMRAVLLLLLVSVVLQVLLVVLVVLCRRGVVNSNPPTIARNDINLTQ